MEKNKAKQRDKNLKEKANMSIWKKNKLSRQNKGKWYSCCISATRMLICIQQKEIGKEQQEISKDIKDIQV